MTLQDNLSAIQARIDRAALDAGRDPADVDVLLAVKTQSAQDIRAAIAAGYTLLGHNRVQEIRATAEELAEMGNLDHQMHMIGHLQSNKVSQALRHVSCVQSVATARLADRLDRAAQARGQNLEVFVQVNTSGEDTKGGVSPDEALELCTHIGGLDHLHLRGLMTIGANSPDPDVVRASYTDLAKLRDAVVRSGAPGTEHGSELSMGMSGDLEIAIAAGATMVRIGTGVFGERPE